MNGKESTHTLSGSPEERRKEFWHHLILRHCRGIGPRTITRLLSRYTTSTLALEKRDEWKNWGISPGILNGLENGSWKKGAESEWNMAEKSASQILLWSDPCYPRQLRELPDAPGYLYYKGDLNLLKSPAVALVGSRNCHPANLAIASTLAYELANSGITVVSGMAMGIDAAVHRGALSGTGRSIGVLGAGINIIYPWANRALYEKMIENGLLLSEFASEEPPLANHFPVRNRIISGLSLGVAVIEAAEKSGSLVTARIALEQNREVFAVPGPAFSNRSSGCQNLIRAGAHPVFSSDDILNQLRESLRPFTSMRSQNIPQNQLELNNREVDNLPIKNPDNDFTGKKIIQEKLINNDSDKIRTCLQLNGKLHIDEISRQLDMELGSLGSLLVGMELMGQIIRLPGGFYEAC